MKIRALSIAIFLLTTLSVYAFEDEFTQAQRAYDEGHYTEATLLYEALVSKGVKLVELDYNLANAHFKNGRLPEAVLHYRKAWHTTPRDPDIRANLRFALNAAGAVDPSPSPLERMLYTFSQAEWILGAVGAYLIFTSLLIFGLFVRPAKRICLQFSVVPILLGVLTLAGWWQWWQLDRHPEWVVVKPGATARFSPIDGSTAHYKIPLAALVRQRNSDFKGWIEVQYDGKNGWLKTEYIHRVSP